MVVVSEAGDYAWVSHIQSGSVSRIDLQAGSVSAQMKTGEGTEGIALSKDERQIWVTNRDEGSLTIHDAVTHAEIGRVEIDGMAIRVEFDPSGRYAVVVSATSGVVTKIDAQTFAVLGEISMRGETAFSTGRFLGGLFGLLPVPVGAQFSEKGDTFYVANSFGGTVVEIELGDLSIRGSFQAEGEPDGMAWLPVNEISGPNAQGRPESEESDP